MSFFAKCFIIMTRGAETKIRITPGAVVVFLVTVYFVVLLRADWVKSIEIRAEEARLEKEIGLATRQKQRLANEISALDAPAYIEVLARKKLGLIKSGETAYKVVR